MNDGLIFAVAVLLLMGLLYFAKRESRRGQLLTKPVLSALFVLTAVIAPHRQDGYSTLVLAGLLLCMGGDIFLIFFDSRKLFLAGLAAFLSGHVLYAIAFFSVSSPGGVAWTGAALSIAAGCGIFIWLRPFLGKMLVPVAAYIAVITAMVIGASSVMGDARFSVAGRLLVFYGALLFFVSDIFVARHRFIRKEYRNRFLGLPLYYAGQFMIALSVRVIG